MGFLCVFLWLSALVAAADFTWIRPLVDDDQAALLQVGARVQPRRNGSLDEVAFYMREGGSGSPYECNQKHPKDLYRPVIQVLNEHPGIDGFCYFGFAAFWLGYSPVHNFLQTSRTGVLSMRQNPMTCANWSGHGSGPKQVGSFELGSFTSHIDCHYYQYDDLYYYSLGWLKNQGLDGSRMSNYTAWRELAAEECEKIRQEYHFTPEESSVGRHVDDNNRISMHSGCAWTGASLSHFCKKPTVREYKLHVYTKCLLGHAADEMAYGYMRACLLPGNVIGHGPECGTCPDGQPCP
mmetsp:Transcript_78419/g.181924  ORF Transcript_78419/g.181924 Transcript_78419/m.181924 type:complete len:294 (+) Transcript_78419:74-955(+)